MGGPKRGKWIEKLSDSQFSERRKINMTLEEAQELQEKLEDNIRNLITQFEEETHLVVEDIREDKIDVTTISDIYQHHLIVINVTIAFPKRNY